MVSKLFGEASKALTQGQRKQMVVCVRVCDHDTGQTLGYILANT